MTSPADHLDIEQLDAIVFDLGGVILNIDYHRTLGAFAQLAGIDDVNHLYGQSQQTHLFDAYESGQISSAQFRQGLRSLLTLDEAVADTELDRAWNAMLLDLPPARLDKLAQLSQQFRLFLLSNTNAIHKAAFEQHLEDRFADSLALTRRFEAVYYSHLVGDRKPNPSIFQRLVDEQGLVPSRTLFVDDTAGHLRGAEAVGIYTLHLTGGFTFEALSDNLLSAF
ncbi:MAG: HAD family phosphatase [Cyanobacteria bacterium P01_A01_bin.135]